MTAKILQIIMFYNKKFWIYVILDQKKVHKYLVYFLSQTEFNESSEVQYFH